MFMQGFRRIRVTVRSLLMVVVATLGIPLLVAGDDVERPRGPIEIRAAAELFHSSSKLSRLDISPDGQSLVALYTDEGLETVVVREIADREWKKVVDLPDPEARLNRLTWANDKRILISTESSDPTAGIVRPRITRLFGIDRDGSDLVHLGRNWRSQLAGSTRVRQIAKSFPSPQFEDEIIDFLPDDPGHILVSIRSGEPFPHVYRLDVESGRITLARGSETGISRWYADHDGVVRAGSGWDGTTFRVAASRLGSGKLKDLARYEPHLEAGLVFKGFSHESNLLYVQYRPDGDRAVLAEYDLATGVVARTLFSQPGFDVPAWLEFDPVRKELEAVVWIGEGFERYFLNDKARVRQAAIDGSLPGTFNKVVSRDRADRHLIVRASSDVQPNRYYLFDRVTQEVQPLNSAVPPLAAGRLAPMRTVSYTARDGLEISALLTLPREGPQTALPFVVYPHGGPSARDLQTYSPVVQYFAHLGYAVFQPNFRGSTGFGLRFRNAGLQQWGLGMQDDVTDGVKWLIETGLADPKRICIFGGSYGGYAALMGLVKTPELYRCGASYAGVSDLPMLLEESSRYLHSERNVPAIGKKGRDKERLRATSPLRNVEKIRVPVFLAHGEMDSRVGVRQTTEMAKALRKKDKPVELLVFEHQPHSSRGESDRIELFERLGLFFEKHLAEVR